MATQLHGCYWVSSPRLQQLDPWPSPAITHQRCRALRLAPPRRACLATVRVVADAGSALALERGVGEVKVRLPTDVEVVVRGEEREDLDERERLRRLRISQANKGNTPWNKGRKHSPETLQRIRERTRLAMQDPKVKKKLMNLGHVQSKETRIKISQGVKRGWSMRIQKLMVQDGCFVEWRDIIADSARKGFAGGVTLQWNSYKILTEQMRQEWFDNIQKRRSLPRPRGNRRAPKTPEQRRKIAEAIAAKWLDQEYRERVCSGIASYHGTPPATRTPRMARSPGEPGVKREGMKKKLMQARVAREDADRNPVIVKRKKSATPYKDPMASEKLDMITKIRVQRAALEIEKKNATRRARSLIEEAEKAANALETAAMTSAFAQASLIEARKLVAEARASLECVDEEGHMENSSDATSLDSRSDSGNNSLKDQNQSNVMKENNKPPNGMKFFPGNVNGTTFEFGISALSETQQLYHNIESSMERAFLLPSAYSTHQNANRDFGVIDFHVNEVMVNGTANDNNIVAESTESFLTGTSEEASLCANAKTTETCPPEPLKEDKAPFEEKAKMRWVRGRLVTVEDEA